MSYAGVGSERIDIKRDTHTLLDLKITTNNPNNRFTHFVIQTNKNAKFELDSSYLKYMCSVSAPLVRKER